MLPGRMPFKTKQPLSKCTVLYSTTLYSCIYAMLWNAMQYLNALCNVMLSYTNAEEGNMCQSIDLTRLRPRFHASTQPVVEQSQNNFCHALVTSLVFSWLSAHLCRGGWSDAADIDHFSHFLT